MTEKQDSKKPESTDSSGQGTELGVGTSVEVTLPDESVVQGAIVEDFGEQPSEAMSVLDAEDIVRPRRWGIELSNGRLVFADDDTITLRS